MKMGSIYIYPVKTVKCAHLRLDSFSLFTLIMLSAIAGWGAV
ncbi:hypothetical protein BVRB_1g015090 [Beta vulgaris subsp. vulgaris]|nr:hypothetical protein BVRB_1g015090 [Beta vulgaris subsp. vulgaris]